MCLRVLSSGVLRAYVRDPCPRIPARKGRRRLGEPGLRTESRRLSPVGRPSLRFPGRWRRRSQDLGRRFVFAPPPASSPLLGVGGGPDGTRGGRGPCRPMVGAGSAQRARHSLGQWIRETRAAGKAPGLSPPRDGTTTLGAHEGKGAETRGTGFPLQATKQVPDLSFGCQGVHFKERSTSRGLSGKNTLPATGLDKEPGPLPPRRLL
ncbi:uncharacterized protein [Equus caballus]|uniref:uncharacterized protein n=1 Tax=Equus caballus TaxID=9796 RepID=UPI0038B418B3